MKAINYFFALLLSCVAVTATAQEIPKWKTADLQQYIAASDRPTIISFWASFCKPCLEEIPYFQELVKKYNASGLQLILVNLDLQEAYPKKIRSVATKFKIAAPIYFLDETNADAFCPAVDKSWSGAIPASLFIDNKTGYRKFFEEQLPEKVLEAEIQKMLGSAKPL